MLYLGIDQHKSQLTVNLRDEDGEAILKRQVSTRWEKVRAFFDDLAEKSQPEGGFMAIVEVCGMNPWLTEMRRNHPPSARESENRHLTAMRLALTKKRTAVLNAIHKTLRKHNLEQDRPTKLFQTKKVRKWLAELDLAEIDRLELNHLLQQWTMLDEQLKVVDEKITERAGADEQAKLLQSMPGLGEYSALAIASRIGDINRFKGPGSLANYFGLTPGCRNSGEATQRLGSITKQGSKVVRYLLGQAVVKVLRFDMEMRKWYKRIKKHREFEAFSGEPQSGMASAS